jgi:hypothetical protein
MLFWLCLGVLVGALASFVFVYCLFCRAVTKGGA